jgi:two-component system, response regulator PdtaR
MKNAVVLVVESEALIRLSAVHIVQDAGYEAIATGNADEAIAVLESRSDIRAVFTDIHMSGTMDGLRLARAVQRRWPPIHVIVTSGLIVAPDKEFAQKWRFIRKPYSEQHVTDALHDLFGDHPAPQRIINDKGRECGKFA